MTDTPATGLRIFLIDDHMAVRQGLAMLLGQAGHRVCAQAETLAEARSLLNAAEVDLALVDLSLGEHSGLDLLPDLLACGVPALIYSMYEDCETIEQAFKAGATGYVTKREVAQVLLEAVDCVAAKTRYLSPRAAQSLASRVIAPQPDQTAEQLSAREKQIIAMLGRGESNLDISQALTISPRTVESYCARIITKLGLDGMKQLRKQAIQITTAGKGAGLD